MNTEYQNPLSSNIRNANCYNHLNNYLAIFNKIEYAYTLTVPLPRAYNITVYT